MMAFMAAFTQYSPYNNMLVRLQNPFCTYFANERDWRRRFGRAVKEDARPMLILQPMGPVTTVYDLDSTTGPPLPEDLVDFARFKIKGEWKPEWLERLVANAQRHRIRVDFKPLSSTYAGFARVTRGPEGEKFRIVVHDENEPGDRFGVLCHELAHIFLGHLGSDRDRWWPARSHLGRRAVEIEAEATAYIVTRHLGLEGTSAEYLSSYVDDGGGIPKGRFVRHDCEGCPPDRANGPGASARTAAAELAPVGSGRTPASRTAVDLSPLVGRPPHDARAARDTALSRAGRGQSPFVSFDSGPDGTRHALNQSGILPRTKIAASMMSVRPTRSRAKSSCPVSRATPAMTNARRTTPAPRSCPRLYAAMEPFRARFSNPRLCSAKPSAIETIRSAEPGRMDSYSFSVQGGGIGPSIFSI